MTCEHCRAIRDELERVNAELGRPVESYDHDRYAVPHRLYRQDVGECDCACHAHLKSHGRRP